MSMVVAENASLESLNTFRIKARAKFLVEFRDAREIGDFIGSPLFQGQVRMILGRGSNILFTGDFDGCILRLLIRGVEKTSEENTTVKIRVGAGENWDDLVQYCVENGYGGLENLSLIPGSVGAAPVQNIGAYGMELGPAVESVEAIDLENGKNVRYSNRQCRFSYRNSIFKKELNGKVIITHVNFILQKKPEFVLSYKDLAKEIQRSREVSLNSIRTSIIAIRRNKLPDHEVLPNAGSFFKNPEITAKKLGILLGEYDDMPHFESPGGMYKIPAAWLIDQCGWKGRREGNVGTYERQPLVIVNYGTSSGSEIQHFSEKVRQTVHEKFGILLETEVNIL